MDGKKFDDLTKRLGSGLNRRQILRGLFGGVGAAAVGAIVHESAAAAGFGEACSNDDPCDSGFVCVDNVCACPEPSRYCESSGSCFSPSTGGCCGDNQCGNLFCINNVCACPEPSRYCESSGSCFSPSTGGCCGDNQCGGDCNLCIDNVCVNECEGTCCGPNNCVTGDECCADDDCSGDCDSCIDGVCINQCSGNCCGVDNCLTGTECCVDADCGGDDDDDDATCVDGVCIFDPCPGQVQCPGANANCCDSVDQCASNGDCCATDRIICGDSCCSGPCDSCVDGQCVSDVTGGVCFDPDNGYAQGVCCSGQCASDGTVICAGGNANCCPSDTQCAGNGDCCATDRIPCDFGCCGPCQTCGDGVCVSDPSQDESVCFDPNSDPQYQQGICCDGYCDSSGITTCEVCLEKGEFCGVLDVQASGGYVDPCCEGLLCYDDYCVECIPEKGSCEWDEDCCDDLGCFGGWCKPPKKECGHKGDYCKEDWDCCHGYGCKDGVCHEKHHKPGTTTTPAPVASLPNTGVNDGDSGGSGISMALTGGAAALLAAKLLRDKNEDEEVPNA